MPRLRRGGLFFSVILLTLALLVSCQKKEEAATSTQPAPSAGGSFQPVPLPNPQIPGYNFPEPETTINAWAATNDQKAISLHAWGIWTALTTKTNETYDGQPLLVFETWQDPADLQAASAATAIQRVPRRLARPHQFQKDAAKVSANESTVLAFVKYDPTAAAHITTNNLFSTAALNKMLADGATEIPTFPNTGVSLKPVFQTLATKQLVNGRYYQLSTWPGSPQLTFNSSDGMWHSKPFPQSLWGQCVWIDTQDTGNGTGDGSVDTTCAKDGSSRTAANTYGLGRFINFKLSAAEAALQNAEAKANNQPEDAAAGDYSVLVAMHVTSRETTRWTWQTFWWVSNPDQPTAPSSPAIAATRPPQLQGAARSYAHCNGYSMEYPPQPNTGGKNVGESIYCFNPYLEAPFDPSDLPDSIPGQTTVNGKPVQTANNVGAQTNCMSCHGRANYNPNNVAGAPNYSGDRYTDLDDPAFKGTLQVDFLWSIPGNAK